MKYIFIREAEKIEGGKSAVFHRNALSENVYIDELILHTRLLDKIILLDNICINNKKNSVKRFFVLVWRKIYINIFKQIVNRLLKTNGYLLKNEDADDNCIKYILSLDICRNVAKSTFLTKMLEEKELKRYEPLNEYGNNIDKYIESYMNKTKLLNNDIKVLIISKDINKLDMKVMYSLICKYKEVDFVTNIDARKRTLDKMERINAEEGTASHVVKVGNKTSKEYNVFVFIDSNRNEHNKLKIRSGSYIIDTANKETDVYNSSLIKVMDIINKEVWNKNSIKSIFNMYGKITTSTILAKDI